MAAPVTTEPTPLAEESSAYDRRFWLAYVANLLLVAGNALTFRFAEFVHFLGGTEEATGGIVRAGVIGSILIRLTLARDLDHLGVRRMWIGSSVLFVVGSLLLVTATEIGWQLYLARAAFAIGLAAMFTCANVHIQNRVPPHRRTEMLASLGSSGFLGMILGAQLGDVIFETFPRERLLFLILFGLTGLLGLVYLGIVCLITRQDVHLRQPETPPPWTLLRRYWPGPVVLVALIMGVGFVVTTVFLTRHATALGLVGIRTYFSAYAISAFSFRLLSRTWSRSLGRHRMICLGLIGHTVGFLLLLRINSEWEFVVPALCGGFAHALLFPCVVSLGAERFPEQYRGTGTTLILGCIDVGTAAGAQPLGWLIDRYGFTPMYLATAALCLGGLLVYAVQMLHAPDADRDHRLVRAATPATAALPLPEVAAPAPLLAEAGHREAATPAAALPR